MSALDLEAGASHFIKYDAVCAPNITKLLSRHLQRRRPFVQFLSVEPLLGFKSMRGKRQKDCLFSGCKKKGAGSRELRATSKQVPSSQSQPKGQHPQSETSKNLSEGVGLPLKIFGPW